MGMMERFSRKKVVEQAFTGAHVTDRLGRRLAVGDLVVQTQVSLRPALLRIVAIDPQLDPSGPKGSVIKAIAEFTFLAPVGRGEVDVLRVAEAPQAVPKDEESTQTKSLLTP